MITVHAIAQSGFAEGTNELYDRFRPTYQPWALEHIRDSISKKGPLNIVEIGSGTGIFTRAILSHPGWSNDIKELRAVEPSEGMRKTFSQRVEDPRVSVSEGTFNNTGIPNGWADVIIIAQAFHWCPDYDSVSVEFSRILKPQGVAVFIWNLEDRDADAWAAQVRDLIEVHEQGSPQFRLGLWRQAFDTASYKEAFLPPDEKVWSYHIPATEEATVDRAASKSYIAVLSADKKAEVKRGIRDILKKGDGLVWIDKDKGIFRYPYKTWVVVSQKWLYL